MRKITITGLPKISLNEWYGGKHWSKRKRIKDDVYQIVSHQVAHVFPKNKRYEVEYIFNWKSRALDASNCVAMLKMIEDVIFEDDRFDFVLSNKISSRKGKKDMVEIYIDELQS